MKLYNLHQILSYFFLGIIVSADVTLGIRFPNPISQVSGNPPDELLKTAVFSLGSFWRSESVFGCLDGVVRTTVGYAGGSKSNPEYRSLGDHAESVQSADKQVPAMFYAVDGMRYASFNINLPETCLKLEHIGKRKLSLRLEKLGCKEIEYDPRVINFRQLLEVFWSSHDPRQVFGQGPDVGNQYRSIIFTNGTDESRLAVVSKEREQTKSRSSIVTTQIQPLGTFYPAEPEHQKFELKRNPFLLQLIGNLVEEELEKSRLASKLNGYAAELCPPRIQSRIDGKINEIIRKGWPILQDV